MTKTMNTPVCMYFMSAKSTSIKDEDLEGNDKYAHKRTTEGHERYRRKIHYLIPVVKADRCQHDSE